jgi:hypothetical protein
MHLTPLLLIVLLLSSCETHPPENSPRLIPVEIRGRDNGISAKALPIYRVKAPLSWNFFPPAPTESLSNTIKPLCEWAIEDPAGPIRITVHNFPTDSIEQRIPPSAQVARWQKQFDQLDPLSSSITQVSFAGFSGLLFEGSGLMNQTQTSVLAWIMQMAPEHYQSLSLHANTSDKSKQQRADFSIKIIGPRESMETHKRTLLAFAQSFELIDEIPSRP